MGPAAWEAGEGVGFEVRLRFKSACAHGFLRKLQRTFRCVSHDSHDYHNCQSNSHLPNIHEDCSGTLIVCCMLISSSCTGYLAISRELRFDPRTKRKKKIDVGCNSCPTFPCDIFQS